MSGVRITSRRESRRFIVHPFLIDAQVLIGPTTVFIDENKDGLVG